MTYQEEMIYWRKEMESNRPRFKGRVRWYNESKGFGFIDPLNYFSSNQESYFIHFSNIKDNKTLHDGDFVSFELKDGYHGKSAVNVTVDCEYCSRCGQPVPRKI